MEKVKQIRWKIVIVGVCLVVIGFVIGVVGTINIANRELEKKDIRLEIDLFELLK